jgi:mannose-6-phosphate isomerase-like protein (cupin superfamily)
VQAGGGEAHASPALYGPAMSDYTIVRRAEAPDFTGDAPGAFLGYTRALGLGQVAFNVRVLEPGTANVPPGSEPDWGHSHRTLEEVYFVVYGELTVKLGDDVHALGPLDAVRIAPATVRAVRNDGAEEAAFVLCSRRIEDPIGDAEPQAGFWTA